MKIMHVKLCDFIILQPLHKPSVFVVQTVLFLRVWGAHVSMETLSTVTKLIWFTAHIFHQIKGVHLNFRLCLGDMKRPLSLSVSFWLTDDVWTLCYLLLLGCLCLAEEGKCLRLTCSWRSLRRQHRGNFMSSCVFLWQPHEAWSSCRDFHSCYKPSIEFILFWLIQRKESTNWSISPLFSVQP